MPQLSIARPPSLVEDVCDRLIAALPQGLAAANGLLPSERALAEQLGVSRPVVREAVKRLESQGLLEVQHGVGIRQVDRLHLPLNRALAIRVDNANARLQQSLEVRRTMEPAVAQLAALRSKASDLRTLRQLHQQLIACRSLPAAAEADIAFHHAIARASGNELFVLVLDSIADLGRESRLATMTEAGVERAIQHHSEILDALCKHDPQAAFAAMQTHLEQAVTDLSAHLKQRPLSFP
jgi:GntR family transcriptional regulator, transcriptional repressor for pyruvate dehydrogenase complex